MKKSLSILATTVTSTLVAALLSATGSTAFADENTTSGSEIISNATFTWGLTPNHSSVRPPFGGSRYFSVGDPGTLKGEAAYSAESGNASVYHIYPGNQSPVTPTYATRADYIKNGGAQFFKFSNGTGTIKADKSVTINWTGTGVINDLGGFVTYWFSDPVLTIDKDGNGSLRANLRGYQANRKEATVGALLEEWPDQELATFKGVSLEATPTTTDLTPRWTGVGAPVRDGGTPQTFDENRGSWPADFVRFHNFTQLAEFFYTTGKSDEFKVPLPITLSYTIGAVEEPKKPIDASPELPDESKPAQESPIDKVAEPDKETAAPNDPSHGAAGTQQGGNEEAVAAPPAKPETETSPSENKPVGDTKEQKPGQDIDYEDADSTPTKKQNPIIQFILNVLGLPLVILRAILGVFKVS
ncbi:MAG: hypothetical protein Q3972_02310 [Corynebacterium sp.]|nr:hypothetical protein [Corynebacterium sp.]